MENVDHSPHRRPPHRWGVTALLLLALLLLATPGSAAVDARLLAGPSLADLAAYAASHSPALRAARAGVAAAEARVGVEGGWLDPRLSAETMTESGDLTLALVQPFPFPGTLSAARSLARAEAEAERVRAAIAVRDTLREMKESFFELAYLREAREVGERNRQLLDLLLAQARAAGAAPTGSVADLLRAESQSAQLDYDRRLLAEQEEAERARLNALLDRPPGAPIGPLAVPALPALSLTPGALPALAGSGSADDALARAEVAAAEAAARRTRKENLPQLELGLSWEEATDTTSVMAGVTLPLWLGKNASRTAAAEAGAEQARALAAGRGNATRAEAAERLFRARSAERLARLYREALLPQAERALATAQSWYRDGRGALTDFVEAAGAWSSYRLAEARARADQGQALARLEATLGVELIPAGGVPALSPPALPAGFDSLTAARLAWEVPAAPVSRFTGDPDRGRTLAEAGALPDGWTADDLAALALLSSPAVKEAEADFATARQAFAQVEAVEEARRAFSTEGPERERPPLGGALALKGRIADREVRLAALALEAARRDAVKDAHTLFAELGYHRAMRELAEEELDIARRLAASARARYATGTGSFAEASAAQAEEERALTGRDSAIRERDPLAASIRALVGWPAEAAVGKPASPELAKGGPVPGPLPEEKIFRSLARENRLELLTARAEAERAALLLELARRETRPTLALDLAPAPALPVPPSVSLPGLDEAFLAESRSRADASSARLRSEEAAADAAVQEAWTALERATREEATAARAATLAQSAFDAARAAYEAGAVPLREALDAARALRAARLAGARAAADRVIARARLAAAAGTPLDR